MQTVTAAEEGGLTKEAQAALEIFGLPGVELLISDVGFDPAEVGKKVTYTIKVKNTGAVAANDIEITAIIPPEMKYLESKATAQATPGDKTVSFSKVTIEPGSERNYFIDVGTLKAGDVRFRVELRAPNLAEPFFQEESTRIFRPEAVTKKREQGQKNQPARNGKRCDGLFAFLSAR